MAEVRFVGLLTHMFRGSLPQRPIFAFPGVPSDPLSRKKNVLHAYSTAKNCRVPDSHRIPLFSEQECVSRGTGAGSRISHKSRSCMNLFLIFSIPQGAGLSRCNPLRPHRTDIQTPRKTHLVNLPSFSKFPLAILFILLYTKPIKDDLPLIRRVHRFGGAPGGKPTVSSCQVPPSRWFSITAVTVTHCCTFTTSPWLPTRVRIEGSPAFPEKEWK